MCTPQCVQLCVCTEVWIQSVYSLCTETSEQLPVLSYAVSGTLGAWYHQRLNIPEKLHEMLW